jgi:Ca-activated chloride channel family protein
MKTQSTTTPALQVLPLQKTFKKGTRPAFVVRLRAPEAGPVAAVRPPLSVAFCIDASGSMSGAPLDHARAAAKAFFDRLSDTDFVSLTCYGSQVRVILERCQVGSVRALFAGHLAAIADGGMTALHDGWLAAANTIAPFATGGVFSRVILLSDGQANHGLTDVTELGRQARLLASAGVSTSTYGLGNGFDEHLMTAMAAGGNACYASSADGLLPNFENEFSLLSKMAGTNVALKVSAKTGSGPVDTTLINLLFEDKGVIHLPNLLSGGDSWAAFELPEASTDVDLDIEANWTGLDGSQHTATTTLLLAASNKGSKTDPDAKARIEEARAARLQKEAAEAARVGDMTRARGAIQAMGALGANNAYIMAVADNLSGVLERGDMAAFGKEATYASSTMSSRVTARNENANDLSADPFGMKKAVQGQAVPSAASVAANPTNNPGV